MYQRVAPTCDIRKTGNRKVINAYPFDTQGINDACREANVDDPLVTCRKSLRYDEKGDVFRFVPQGEQP